MGRRKNRSSLNTVTGIDVTPLIDLTFILLIVFMVTSAATKSIVTLPEYGEPQEVEADTKVIWLDKDGKYYFNKIEVTEKQLNESLAFEKNTPGDFGIGADERRSYGEVMKLMRLVRKHGITNVKLITAASEE